MAHFISVYSSEIDPRSDDPATDDGAVHEFCCNGCGEDVLVSEAIEDEEGHIWHTPCQEQALDNYEPPDPEGWEGGFAENH